MKLLNNINGFIGKKYGAYDKKSVQSYLSGGKGHLFVNFALEDREIKKILREYELANNNKKVELGLLYNNRVKKLIKSEDFCIKNVGKYNVLPSVEVSNSKIPGYLVGMFGKREDIFEKYGEAIYVPCRFYESIKMIQHVEKRGSIKRVCGLYYVPDITEFEFCIITRNRNLDGKYYLEKVSIDKENCSYNSRFLDSYDFNNYILELKEI